jgi:hypothetical protein
MNKFGCFVYYNKKTGNIELITNERQGKKKNFIEIDPDLYSKLVSNEYNPLDYAAGYLRDPNGSVVLSLVKKERKEIYVFRSTEFVSITNPPTKDTELIISWKKKSWEFELSSSAKSRINNSLDQSMLMFFVTLESDFDFLIRTIFIEPYELRTKKKIIIPFETEYEQNIDKISIASKLSLQSYGIQKYE